LKRREGKLRATCNTISHPMKREAVKEEDNKYLIQHYIIYALEKVLLQGTRDK
jgi:hypothetical protein